MLRKSVYQNSTCMINMIQLSHNVVFSYNVVQHDILNGNTGFPHILENNKFRSPGNVIKFYKIKKCHEKNIARERKKCT